jgi:hypothetical protein
MDSLHGYSLLVVARKISTATVWHYSTGNDEPVCGRGGGDGMVGYINVETAANMKGCCNLCARYVGTHGDYQGYDSENNTRYLSISNPKPVPVMHFGMNESACGRESERKTTHFPNVNCEDCIATREMPSEELWNAEDIPNGWQDGTHKSNSDFDAAMVWPQKFYRGMSEIKARRILASKLAEAGGFEYVVRAGESHLYVSAAHAIMDGTDNVKIHGRIYRIRQGVPVNQTYGKGL